MPDMEEAMQRVEDELSRQLETGDIVQTATKMLLPRKKHDNIPSDHYGGNNRINMMLFGAEMAAGSKQWQNMEEYDEEGNLLLCNRRVCNYDSPVPILVPKKGKPMHDKSTYLKYMREHGNEDTQVTIEYGTGPNKKTLSSPASKAMFALRDNKVKLTGDKDSADSQVTIKWPGGQRKQLPASVAKGNQVRFTVANVYAYKDTVIPFEEMEKLPVEDWGAVFNERVFLYKAKKYASDAELAGSLAELGEQLTSGSCDEETLSKALCRIRGVSKKNVAEKIGFLKDLSEQGLMEEADFLLQMDGPEDLIAAGKEAVTGKLASMFPDDGRVDLVWEEITKRIQQWEELKDYTPEELPPLAHLANARGFNVQYEPGENAMRPSYGSFNLNTNEITLRTHSPDTLYHEMVHAYDKERLQAQGEKLKGGQHVAQEARAGLGAAVLSMWAGESEELVKYNVSYALDYMQEHIDKQQEIAEQEHLKEQKRKIVFDLLNETAAIVDCIVEDAKHLKEGEQLPVFQFATSGSDNSTTRKKKRR